MIGSRVLILIALIFLSPSISFAQSGDTALKEKAYELLESLSTQLSTLQSAENRARIGSNIAGTLWPHDEKRARALFIAVGQDINLGLQPSEDGTPEDHKTFLVFFQLRSDTIQRIARYDPEFAFDFLKTTEPRYEGRIADYGRDRERALSVQLAKQLVNSNPDIALKVARAALAHGFSEDLLTVLRPLLRKHREQGVIFHKEIVRKLRNTKPGDDYRLIEFFYHLSQVAPPLADEATYEEFRAFLTTTARTMKCDQERTGDLDSAYFCDQLAHLLKRNANRENVVSNPEADVYQETEQLARDGDIDGLLQLAEKNPLLKNRIYSRAFYLARATGDLERGQKIAAAYEGDPNEKQFMLDQVEKVKDAAALSETELEEIQKTAETIADVRQRADYLAENALRIGVNNKKVAIKLLDQLTDLVDTHKKGSEHTELMLVMAVLYCMEKADRGFTIMGSQMPRLNELIDAAVKLDGFDTHYVRDGEWNMSAAGDLGRLLTFVSNNAPYFAWCDFDRAVNLAAQFERAEIRMMAQLKLAQGIIAGPPPRLRTGWGKF